MFTYPIGLLSGKKGDVLDLSFKFIVNTALGIGASFTLPLPSGASYDFYWNPGDGSTDRHVTAYNDLNASYTYPGGHGTYTVKVGVEDGDICGGWSFNNGGDKLKITSIIQWGQLSLTNLTSGFRGCTNLGNVADLTGYSGTNLTNLFFGCTNLNINNTFFSNVTTPTSIQYAFGNSGITVFPYLNTLMNLGIVYGAFVNCLGLNGATIPENYFYYNSNVNNYKEAFANIRNLILPSVMFNLANIPVNCDFTTFMYVSSTGYSATGTIQDVWNYATSGSHSNAFTKQTSISNYASIPDGWKGL
jgi:hypothetical protein